jgi:hypothetical protein
VRGKKTTPAQIEEIKALSLIYSPATIAEKTNVSLRTVYEVIRKKDDPIIEQKREEKRLEIVDKIWQDKEGELLRLREKSDLILNSINEEKIARANLSQLTIGYGTLFDKRRLLVDKSTQNISSIIKIVEEIDLKFKNRGESKE